MMPPKAPSKADYNPSPTRESLARVVKTLVAKFNAHKSEYESDGYLESDLKADFINRLFGALGWAINDENNKGPVEKEVFWERGECDGRPDYNFRINGNTTFYLEAKSPNAGAEKLDSIFQVKKYAWSDTTNKVELAVLTDFAMLKVYDATFEPIHDNPDLGLLFSIPYQDFASNLDKLLLLSKPSLERKEIFALFSREKALEKFKVPPDERLLKILLGFRERLAKDVSRLNPGLSLGQMNDTVTTFLNRLLFIRVLEDRNIIPSRKLKECVDLWEELQGRRPNLLIRNIQNLFDYINSNFNGSLFEEDVFAKADFEPSNLASIIKNLYGALCPFQFNLLDTRTLGNIYEQFLSWVPVKSGRTVKYELKEEVKSIGGVVYTKKEIVDYMVKKSMASALEGLTPDTLPNFRVLDPSCGSGSFLLGVYEYLINWHLKYYSKKPKAHLTKEIIDDEGRYQLSFKSKHSILLKMLYGIDRDSDAVKITVLSLCLKALENEKSISFGKRLLPNLRSNIVPSNALFCDPENINGEFPKLPKNASFELVIGNPPYGASISLPEEPVPRELDETMRALFPDIEISDYEKLNTFALFLLNGLKRINDSGFVHLLISDTFRTILSFEAVRNYLLESRSIVSCDICPDDTFSPHIINTCMIQVGGPGRDFDTISTRDFSRISYKQMNNPSIDAVIPEHVHEADELSRINGNPLVVDIHESIKSLMVDNENNQTLGLGSPSLVGSYQGLATGNDPEFLAILENADLTGLTIKTGINSIRRIKLKDVCVRPLTPEEIENGISKGPTYVPFVKATRTARYYYQSPLYVNWSRQSLSRMKTRENDNGRIASRFQNSEKYFLPCLVSSGEEGLLSTFFVSNSVPAVSTNIIISESNELSAKVLCSILNSSLMSYIVSNAINGSLKGMSSHVTPLDIRRLPYRTPTRLQSQALERHVDRILVKVQADPWQECKQEQTQINKIIFDIYGIPAVARTAIDNAYFSKREEILARKRIETAGLPPADFASVEKQKKVLAKIQAAKAAAMKKRRSKFKKEA